MTPEEIKNYFLEAPNGKRPGGTVCRALVLYPDKPAQKYTGEVCHRFLGRYPMAGCSKVYTSLWYDSKGKIKKAAQAYWNFILGDTSPWRSILADREVVRDDDGYPIAVGINITADTSSQVLANLCMATRLPFEHVGNLRLWYWLTTKGYSPHEALLVSCFATKQGNRLGPHPHGNWHFAFNTQGNTPTLKQLRDGTPNPDGRKVTKGNDYLYSDKIWGGNKGTHPIERALNGAEPYKGIFEKRFKYYNPKGLLEENGVIANLSKALAALEATRHEW